MNRSVASVSWPVKESEIEGFFTTETERLRSFLKPFKNTFETSLYNNKNRLLLVRVVSED